MLEWHKTYSENWRNRLGFSHYGIYWLSFVKGIILVLLLQWLF